MFANAGDGDGRAPANEGVIGNERLTAASGVALLLVLFVVLASSLRVGSLMAPHVFAGALAAALLTVKLASVGYRFARYYTGSQPYVAKGPPRISLRLLAPALIATTIVLVASGFALLATGPNDPGLYLALHNITSIFWLPMFAVHAFTYWRRAGRETAREVRAVAEHPNAGQALRLGATGAAAFAGCAVGAALLPVADPWTMAGIIAQQVPAPVVVGAVISVLTLATFRALHWTT